MVWKCVQSISSQLPELNEQLKGLIIPFLFFMFDILCDSLSGSNPWTVIWRTIFDKTTSKNPRCTGIVPDIFI